MQVFYRYTENVIVVRIAVGNGSTNSPCVSPVADYRSLRHWSIDANFNKKDWQKDGDANDGAKWLASHRSNGTTPFDFTPFLSIQNPTFFLTHTTHGVLHSRVGPVGLEKMTPISIPRLSCPGFWCGVECYVAFHQIVCTSCYENNLSSRGLSKISCLAAANRTGRRLSNNVNFNM